MNNGSGGPSEFVKSIKGKQVKVKLNQGISYIGTFVSMDGCLNVVLENVYIESKSKTQQPKQTDIVVDNENQVFSECYIRGNNVTCIVPFN
mmetsp:Transcript_32484/g.23467  ORF Transcript_32484/g.23467 Transcript_32484/m.23467 type:complete len:91 (+) Transcript_32484:30-302(+)